MQYKEHRSDAIGLEGIIATGVDAHTHTHFERYVGMTRRYVFGYPFTLYRAI